MGCGPQGPLGSMPAWTLTDKCITQKSGRSTKQNIGPWKSLNLLATKYRYRLPCSGIACQQRSDKSPFIGIGSGFRKFHPEGSLALRPAFNQVLAKIRINEMLPQIPPKGLSLSSIRRSCARDFHWGCPQNQANFFSSLMPILSN